MTLREQLQRDEGLRLTPYRDTVGKLTLGFGHNLDDKPISRRAAEVILDDDIADVEQELRVRLPWLDDLGAVRRGVLINMAFNLGPGGLLGFSRFLAAMQAQDWPSAVREMLDSRWYRQVGLRAERLARQVAIGEWQ